MAKTGAERVAQHRQRQLDRIAELEAQVAAQGRHPDVAGLQVQVLTAQLTRDGQRPTRSQIVKELGEALAQAHREYSDLETKMRAEMQDLKGQVAAAEQDARAAHAAAVDIAAGNQDAVARRLGGLLPDDLDTLGSFDTAQLAQFAKLAKRMAQRGDQWALYDALRHVTGDASFRETASVS